MAARFRTHMHRRGFAPGTVTIRMRWFYELLEEGALADLDEETIERILDRHHYQPSSRRCAISHCRQIYRWARHVGVCPRDHDPTEFIDSPHVPKYLPHPARDVDVALALSIAQGPALAAVALARCAGLRISEVAAATWADYDRDRAELRIRGKGSKDRIVPVTPELAAILARIDQTDDPRVVGAPAWKCYELIVGVFSTIGVKVNPHRLRHSFATAVVDETGDIQAAADLLGHESVATTQVYAKVSAQRLRAAANASQVRRDHGRARRVILARRAA